MANSLLDLLTYIVANPVMYNEAQEAEIDATAVQDVEQEVREIATDQQRDAQRLAPAFAAGLRNAATTRGPLVVDDTSPEGNQIADAFARYLVTTGLATAQTETLSEGHYRYTFDINWPALRQTAQEAGIDLEAALSASP